MLPLLGWAHIAALWLKKLDAHCNRHALSQPRRATMILNQNSSLVASVDKDVFDFDARAPLVCWVL